ncbi:MAG: hypothetical protein NT090_16285 [Acidobacteria bacterium]|nr:hypothetical protein [Acidobacteriota bacterium]
MRSPLEKPILTAYQAAALIRDGQTVAIGGSGAGHAIPERMLEALGRRFRASGAPRGLQLIHPFGVGNQGSRGLEQMAHPEMYARIVGGHWSMSPSMAKLAARNLFEAYCLPAGVIVQLFHAAAAGSPGYMTEIGLHTFVDPRLEGGKLNDVTREDIVELARRNGKEYLFYPAIPIDVALIKGAVADAQGNISMREEVAPWHNLAMAQAARANGGITIAQVKRVVEAGSLDPRDVRVPGIFVDCLIVDPAHGMTYEIFYEPALAGDTRKPESEFPPFEFSLRKVVARRAAMELCPGAVLNVGFGMPDGVIKVAREQGFADQVVATIEQGQIGGIPAEGLEFGAAYNSTAIVETGQQFAFYHGRGGRFASTNGSGSTTPKPRATPRSSPRNFARISRTSPTPTNSTSANSATPSWASAVSSTFRRRRARWSSAARWRFAASSRSPAPDCAPSRWARPSSSNASAR